MDAWDASSGLLKAVEVLGVFVTPAGFLGTRA
jgi:hypothetical protein